MVREAAAKHGPGSSRHGERVALFIDFENLALGAIESLPGRAEPVPAKSLKWLCLMYGPTTVRRAYADWANPTFRRYQRDMELNGIDLVQIGHGPQRKNSADIRMAVDAMETLFLHPTVDTYVLVTGDSDFSPLVAKLREYGKYVVGVGPESAASARLVAVCSTYELFGDIVRRVEPTQSPESAETTVAQRAPSLSASVAGTTQSNRPDLGQAEDLLVSAMQQIDANTPSAAALKSKMLGLDSTFDTLDYGCRTFRDFLEVMGHRVRVVGQSGHDITLTLIEPSDSSP